MTKLSADDLKALWMSTADSTYTSEFAEGAGLEAYEQLFEQMARVSEAIDVSTQAMYTQPHSAQTAPPAGLASPATAPILASRSTLLQFPIFLEPNRIWFEEVTSDWSEDVGGQGQKVPTGRLYTPVASIVFLPGTTAVSANIISKGVGYGFNNPQVGSISLVHEPLTVSGQYASVENRGLVDALVYGAKNKEFPGPDHIGRYLLFTDGSNIGKFRRIVGIEGNAILLEHSFYATGSWSDTPIPGETLWWETPSSSSYAIKLLAASSSQCYGLEMTPFPLDPAVLATMSFKGSQSGAIFVPASVPDPNALLAEIGTAQWRTVSFVAEFGFTVKNTAKPTGGVAGILEEIGRERGVFHIEGESQEDFRKRVVSLPDVVTPNAVKRAANRILSIKYKRTAIVREPGTANLPGFFYDEDWYDNDSLYTTPPVRGFVSGEKVHQYNAETGQLSTGVALVDFGTGDLVGIGKPDGPFSPDYDTVGEWSGTIATIEGNGGLQEVDRYRYYFNDQETKRFFLVTFPSLTIYPQFFDPVNFAYDTEAQPNAYDLTISGKQLPWAFYDSVCLERRKAYKAIWKAINSARAAGVSFDLALDEQNVDWENVTPPA